MTSPFQTLLDSLIGSWPRQKTVCPQPTVVSAAPSLAAVLDPSPPQSIVSSPASSPSFRTRKPPSIDTQHTILPSALVPPRHPDLDHVQSVHESYPPSEYLSPSLDDMLFRLEREFASSSSHAQQTPLSEPPVLSSSTGPASPPAPAFTAPAVTSHVLAEPFALHSPPVPDTHDHRRTKETSPVSPTLSDVPKKTKRSMSTHHEITKTTMGIREIAKKLEQTQLKWEVPPKKVLIVSKVWDAAIVRLTYETATWLITIGLTVYVEDRLKDDPSFGRTKPAQPICESPESDSEECSEYNCHTRSHTVAAELDPEKLRFWNERYCKTLGPSEIDFIVTLGGDGTVLFAAWLFQERVPPIVPFHLGSLGFLTVFEFAKFRSSIHRIVTNHPDDGMKMNTRIRFGCTLHRKQPKPTFDPLTRATIESDDGRTFQILNDLVVDRGPSSYMSQLELYVNGRHMTTVQADGLVVGTPTGSTAYSMSAGGSVVHPDVSAILITPICPHTLSFRPMILPDTVELKIVVPEDSRSTAWASFDGRHRLQLFQGDSITISASQFPVPTVCVEDQSADWLKGLERCLGYNQRERQKALQLPEW